MSLSKINKLTNRAVDLGGVLQLLKIINQAQRGKITDAIKTGDPDIILDRITAGLNIVGSPAKRKQIMNFIIQYGIVKLTIAFTIMLVREGSKYARDLMGMIK